MDLIIVESPSKAKTIEKYLGGQYRVLASAGHIRDLPERRLGIDVDNDFQPEYILNPQKADILRHISTEMKRANKVYLATDPDREGEAISWHLKEVLEIKEDQVRIEFNEISKNAISNALQNPRSINIQLVDAQQARRVLDRLVGYKISPIISNKIKSGLSGGRVQSVALKLIVDRENEIRDFVVEEFWNFHGMFSKDSAATKTFKATLNDINGKKFKIDNEQAALQLKQALLKCDYKVARVKNSVSKSYPAPPYTTSTLQQDGSIRLKLTAPEVMRLAQQLYEGVDVSGEGHIALVTYIRTDSLRISNEAQFAARRYITDTYGEKYAPKKFNFYKNKDAAQDAHEAIRPITLNRSPESIKDKVNKNQYRLYKLIYERFVASQMVPAEYDTVNVDIEGVNGNYLPANTAPSDDITAEYTDNLLQLLDQNEQQLAKFGTKEDANVYNFKVKGKCLRFDGYTCVTRSSGTDEDSVKLLPVFDTSDKLTLTDVVSEQKFTTPPSRFNDATLVKEMEEQGIGRPSTYASIISVIEKREYVEKKEFGEKKDKFFVPTPLGEKVVELLNKYFPEIMNVQFTADMENNLDRIEDGVQWQEVIKDFYPTFNKEVIRAKNDHSKLKLNCEATDLVCEKCGSPMIIRDGKYGKFLACSAYPDCKNVKQYGEIIAKCPVCGDNVIKKKSKNGKTYYLCSASPRCAFFSFDVPAPFLCPKCNSTVRMTKRGEITYYSCTKCEYSEKKGGNQ